MKKLALAVLTAVCCISTATYALNLNDSFKELDKDSNGILSESEASEDALLHDNFSQIDTNQDGQISFSEFQLFVQ
ncbi:EF-hand domain-containing protein [Pseudoalteromonas sp. CF6-2]|uniref:EF-hand domain-containing protein n=1 Tax=Pseudoalteromonas sp. CF6-2 TaxID=562716 RepID=UPI001F22A9D6|nr:EF-hand domain-containing protein [Pseudoalteromonas sp. CF6-2]